MDLSKLQNGSDIRGVAVEGVEGVRLDITEHVCKIVLKLAVAAASEGKKLVEAKENLFQILLHICYT